MLKLALMASGSGTNAENIIRFWQERPDLISVECVITDQPEAGVIERVRHYAIPLYIIERVGNGSVARSDHEEKIDQILQKHKVEWICLCGYMRIFSAQFVEKWSRFSEGHSRLINIHPSLLPAFPGKESYQQALNYGVKVTGVTVHFVDKGVDTGPILLQEALRVDVNETIDSLKRKGQAIEYRLYRQALIQLGLKKEKWIQEEQGALQ